jgi:hypothetical protein
MQHNLMGDGRWKKEEGAEMLPEMERELKAIIQQYMERMTENRLLPVE